MVRKLSICLCRSWSHKRLGTEITYVVYLILRWTWLKTESIDMFSLEARHSFTVAKKDVIYDNLKREVVNWCRLHCQVALQV